MAIGEKCVCVCVWTFLVRTFSELLCHPCCKQLRNNLHKCIAYNENGFFQQYPINKTEPNRTDWTESSQQSKHAIPFDFNMHENENLLMRKFTNHTKLCSGIFDTNSRTKHNSIATLTIIISCVLHKEIGDSKCQLSRHFACETRKNENSLYGKRLPLSQMKEWLEFVATKKFLLLHYC